MQEPTFDLEQTILDLVAVVSSLNPLHATPEQQAAMQRLRSLVQQLQSPAVVVHELDGCGPRHRRIKRKD
jgi:hypothetical protein